MTPPSKKLIVHIGFHKTGTSALQEALFNNTDALAEVGFIYPKPLCKFQSHLDLAAALFPDELPWVKETFEFDQTFDHYAQVVSDAPAGSTIMVSSEELCRIDQRTPLHTAIHGKLGNLPDTQTQILAYTREPVAFLMSLYHHQIRVGVYNGTFHDFTNGYMNLNNVRFDRRLAGWRDVFGAENVLVQDYDLAMKTYGFTGIVADFLNLIGCGDMQLPQSDRPVNVGVHPWLLEAYRQIYDTELPEREKRPLYEGLLALGANFPRVKAAEYYLGAKGVAELRARIADPTVAF